MIATITTAGKPLVWDGLQWWGYIAATVRERRRVHDDETEAFVVGVEATCRLSKAVSVAPAKGNIAWSQTGIACGIGAALAVARLMRLVGMDPATALLRLPLLLRLQRMLRLRDRKSVV